MHAHRSCVASQRYDRYDRDHIELISAYNAYNAIMSSIELYCVIRPYNGPSLRALNERYKGPISAIRAQMAQNGPKMGL